jgi:hypothetical protein
MHRELYLHLGSFFLTYESLLTQILADTPGCRYFATIGDLASAAVEYPVSLLSLHIRAPCPEPSASRKRICADTRFRFGR